MRAWAAVMLVIALTGCTRAAEGPVDVSSDAPAASADQPAGVVDPLAVTEFACRQNAKGRWQARGVLHNSGEQVRDYRLTVFVGQQTGPARTVDVSGVQGGARAEFTLKPVVAAPDGPCRIQALILP